MPADAAAGLSLDFEPPEGLAGASTGSAAETTVQDQAAAVQLLAADAAAGGSTLKSGLVEPVTLGRMC